MFIWAHISQSVACSQTLVACNVLNTSQDEALGAENKVVVKSSPKGFILKVFSTSGKHHGLDCLVLKNYHVPASFLPSKTWRKRREKWSDITCSPWRGRCGARTSFVSQASASQKSTFHCSFLHPNTFPANLCLFRQKEIPIHFGHNQEVSQKSRPWISISVPTWWYHLCQHFQKWPLHGTPLPHVQPQPHSSQCLSTPGSPRSAPSSHISLYFH